MQELERRLRASARPRAAGTMGEQRLLPPAYFSQFRDGAEHARALGWPHYLPQYYSLAEPVLHTGWTSWFSQFQERAEAVPQAGDSRSFSQLQGRAEAVPQAGDSRSFSELQGRAESVPQAGESRSLSQLQGRAESVPQPGWTLYWPQLQDRAEAVPQPGWALYWPHLQDRAEAVPQRGWTPFFPQYYNGVEAAPSPGWTPYSPQLHDGAEPAVARSDGGGSQRCGTGTRGPRQPRAASSELPTWAKVLAPVAYEPLRFFCSPPGTREEEKRLGAARRPVKKLQLEDEICEVCISLKKLELLALIGERIDRYHYKLLEALRDEKIQLQKARKKRRRWPPTA